MYNCVCRMYTDMFLWDRHLKNATVFFNIIILDSARNFLVTL